MAARTITHLLLDTSYLRGVGLRSPDFQKLLELAKANTVKLLVPHIAWEEQRTQFLDETFERMRKVRDAFSNLNVRYSRDFLLEGLPAPGLVLWEEKEVYEKSKETMRAFAVRNKIEIVEIAPDHAVRSWDRYFSVGLPFDPKEEREERRKDIPDSWILACALDLKGMYPNLRALCGDVRLSDALEAHGISVYRITQTKKAAEVTRDVMAAIEAELAPEPAKTAWKTRDAAYKAEPSPATATDGVMAALAGAESDFRDLEIKVLGYVASLDTVGKDQLFDLLGRVGIPAEKARNAAERLTLVGILVDTGNHYLVGNKTAGEQAAKVVEPEIIKLLGGG